MGASRDCCTEISVIVSTRSSVRVGMAPAQAAREGLAPYRAAASTKGLTSVTAGEVTSIRACFLDDVHQPCHHLGGSSPLKAQINTDHPCTGLHLSGCQFLDGSRLHLWPRSLRKENTFERYRQYAACLPSLRTLAPGRLSDALAREIVGLCSRKMVCRYRVPSVRAPRSS
jgi:hypothetical protein